MAGNFRIRADKEADKIGEKFAYSSDVIRDMSRAYHVDFSKVRIHTDEAAAQKVREAGKDGLAQGNHLFFGRGIFQSNAPEDKKLVAHELVHTMQQGVTDARTTVSEHVPMGIAQYSRKNPKREVRKLFDEYTRDAIAEEGEVPDNWEEDPDYIQSLRPSWMDTELELGIELENQGFEPQVAFFNGDRVVGRRMIGCVIPDFYKPGISIDAKNYNIESVQNRSNLIRNIAAQYWQRVIHLPWGTRQGVIIDLRGQEYDSRICSWIRYKIKIATSGGMDVDFKKD